MLFIGYAANAQLLSAGFTGIKGGFNESTLTGGGYSGIAGYHVGVMARIKVLMFAVQPEVLFTSQGGKSKLARVGDDRLYTNRLNYLAVPVMFQYYMLPGLNVELGPQVEFLLSGKAKFDGGGSTNIKSELNKAGMSFNVGAAFQLPFIRLGVSARYCFGLTNVFDSSTGSNAKNSVFQLGAFYRF